MDRENFDSEEEYQEYIMNEDFDEREEKWKQEDREMFNNK